MSDSRDHDDSSFEVEMSETEPDTDGGFWLTVSVLVASYNWAQVLANPASPQRVSNLYWALAGTVGVIAFGVIFGLSVARLHAWRRAHDGDEVDRDDE